MCKYEDVEMTPIELAQHLPWKDFRPGNEIHE